MDFSQAALFFDLYFQFVILLLHNTAVCFLVAEEELNGIKWCTNVRIQAFGFRRRGGAVADTFRLSFPPTAMRHPTPPLHQAVSNVPLHTSVLRLTSDSNRGRRRSGWRWFLGIQRILARGPAAVWPCRCLIQVVPNYASWSGPGEWSVYFAALCLVLPAHPQDRCALYETVCL